MSNTNVDIVSRGVGSEIKEDFGTVERVLVSRIRRYEGQPRKFFDPDELADLGRSLKRKQRLPIKVRRINDDPLHDFELVDGERRWRAAQSIGLPSLLAWIRSVSGENEQFLDSVVSNLCRAGHTPLEKAESLRRLKDMGMSREEIANECGYSTGWVDQHLSLLNLAPEVQALMDPERPKEKQLPFPIAVRLASLPTGVQIDIANEIVKKKMPAKQARFLVQNRTHRAGLSGAGGRMPFMDYRIITGFIDRAMEESKLVLGMPNGTFVSALGSRSEDQIVVLTSQIEQVIANLQNLSKKIKTAKGVVNARFEK